MSRDHRDQRGGHRHRSCECCPPVTGIEVRRTATAAIAESRNDAAEPEREYFEGTETQHLVIEHRCLRCGMNDLDIELYGGDCTNESTLHYRLDVDGSVASNYSI